MVAGQIFAEKLPARGTWTVLRLSDGDSALVYFLDAAGRYGSALVASPSHAWLLHFIARLMPLLGHGAEHWEAALCWAEHRAGRKRDRFVALSGSQVVGGKFDHLPTMGQLGFSS